MFVEKITSIVASICAFYAGDDEGKEMAIDMLQSALKAIMAYVDSVYNAETQMPILRFIKEGQDFRDAVIALDNTRRTCHNAVIASLSSVDRLCKVIGAPALYGKPINDNVRTEIAEFCMDMVENVFGGRTDVKLEDIVPNI